MGCGDILFVLQRNWSHVILGIQSETGEYRWAAMKDKIYSGMIFHRRTVMQIVAEIE